VKPQLIAYPSQEKIVIICHLKPKQLGFSSNVRKTKKLRLYIEVISQVCIKLMGTFGKEKKT